MKGIFFLLLVTLNSSLLFAQDDIADSALHRSIKNSNIKINLSALPLKNLSLQYEIKTSVSTSFLLTLHYMPYGKFNSQNLFVERYKVSKKGFGEMEIGSMGIAPEFRFYLTEGGSKGLYIGPFAAFNRYKMSIPVNYTEPTDGSEPLSAVFKGTFNSFSGGIQLGFRFNLSRSIVMDFSILGMNLGEGSGEFVYEGALNHLDQQSLDAALDKIRRKLVLDVIRGYEVNAAGAIIHTNGPVIGFRPLALNFGFRF